MSETRDPHDHTDGHVTKTFGLRALLPIPHMWVIRLNPTKRADLPIEEKMRIMDVCERWIGRWALRHNLTWGNSHVAQTDSDDALVLGFLAVQGLPPDWQCLGGMISDLYREDHDSHSPTILPVAILQQMGIGIPDLPDIDPDDKETRLN